MVNQKRLRKKLPELLVDGPLTDKANFDAYRRYGYHLRRLEKRKSGVVDVQVKEFADLLENLKKSLCMPT
jgi:hypothetical protein